MRPGPLTRMPSLPLQAIFQSWRECAIFGRKDDFCVAKAGLAAAQTQDT
jgi:hypothetical protein